jgi:hypothetical protein
VASLESIAIRKAEATARIDKAAAALAKLVHLRPMDWEQSKSKDPDVADAMHLELVAATFEEVVRKTDSTISSLKGQLEAAKAAAKKTQPPNTPPDAMTQANARATAKLEGK